MTPELEATLKRLPDRPGVYLLKDARGDVLYVGKAQSLRHRVRSYWQKHTPAVGEGHRIRSVIDRIAEVPVADRGAFPKTPVTPVVIESAEWIR